MLVEVLAGMPKKYVCPTGPLPWGKVPCRRGCRMGKVGREKSRLEMRTSKSPVVEVLIGRLSKAVQGVLLGSKADTPNPKISGVTDHPDPLAPPVRTMLLSSLIRLE
ncbi:unnamed protein product [Cuscuta epithymum]|uniref:Uncharacterized protein n=1 Tax=Cuscuta epithymum TaxID=186058 RepID=A0AAV0D2D2_9ASTE|nr:unnamed protein product [Cuscuta epithymum]